MVVDFSKLNLKERQTLILKNQDGTYIQPLVFAHNLEAKLCYNEVSEITFDVPAYVDCLRTPSYDEIVGMRLIDWYGIGQFILMDPSTTNDGIKEIKTCKAYSLEYELTFKQFFLEDGTYNFWNPVDSKNTVLGIILKLLPSWRVGAVDASLIGKYRTFEASNQSIYDFVKNTLQDTYQCIFDFDTYNRTINVHAVTELVDTKPVYLSLSNLIKEINVEEDTQNIFTCLDVNGADGVDIRSVNPMGTNKIYNLDYFMNTTYFSQDMIDKWNAWKTKYKNSQSSYFNISIEKVMQEAKLAVEEAALADLKGELSKLEELQAVYAEAATKNIDGKSDDLTKVKEDITAKKSEITAKEKDIETIKNDIKAYGDQQVAMNKACAFESFFTDAELTLLDRYFKESSISDESFVYQTVSSYSKDAETAPLNSDITFEIAASDIVGVSTDDIPSPGSALQSAYDALAEYQSEATLKGSHVDYMHRVVLHTTASNLEFYREYFDSPDLEVGDIITLHSFTYEWPNLGGTSGTTWAINVTPIKPDGSLFESHDKFLEYVAGLFDEKGVYQSSRDTESIVMSYFDEGNVNASIQKAVDFATEAHELHETYYNLLEERDISAMMVRCSGGVINVEVSGKKLTAHIVNGAFESKDDDTVLMTAYLSDGTFGSAGFKEACVSVSGTFSRLKCDLFVDETGELHEGSYISFNASDGYFLLNYDASEYAKRSVEWELFEFGQENLEKLCWPTYTFSIEAANFLAMDEFTAFKNQFALGSKIYLDLGNGRVLSPIAVGAELNADDPTSFKLTFGDKYSLNDSAFKLVDLLEQAVSVGQTTASKLKTFNSFVESGASSEIYDYINSALNAAKNVVLAGQNQSTQIDGSGIRCRSYNPESGTFDDEQIWIINNNIVFTKNNWDSAEMALGHIVDAENNIDDWGLVANLLVGKMVAGNNLVIEAQCANNENVEFKVDQSGVRISNARLDLISAAGQIALYPNTGLIGGKQSVSSPLYTYDDQNNITGIRTEKGNSMQNLSNLDPDDLPNANFWLDMEGNAFFKGNGQFTGTVHATDGKFSGTVNARELQLDGINVSDIIKAHADPEDNAKLDRLEIGDITIDGETGAITFADDTDIVLAQYSTAPSGPWQESWDDAWDGVSVWVRYSYNGGTTWTGAMLIQGKNGVDGEDGSDANVPGFIRNTYIDATQVTSCAIYGNEVYANGAFVLAELEQNASKSRVTVGDYYGMMGLATGLDAGGKVTYGVAMADGETIEINDGQIEFTSEGRYIIVTNKGIRLQAGSTTLTLTESGAYYNGIELGVGGEGGGVAVFG